MNSLLARLVSGLIRDKKARHDVRNILTNKHTSGSVLYDYLYRAMKVKSLREYIAQYKTIGEILDILTPYDVIGIPKVRIGGDGDGGYVMLDPGLEGGVAYSLGISPHSPWDLEMASRKYNVFQFDGTIESPPDAHPNLHFQKVNIVSSKNSGVGKSLEQLFHELGHDAENNIILQMDIEGAEWDVLQDLTESQMSKFRQIIIELHGLMPTDVRLPDKLDVLRTISRTHKPVHIHLNNCCSEQSLKEGLLFYSPVYEVTYVRTHDHSFKPCTETFPTSLDSPNWGGLPDIALGIWP